MRKVCEICGKTFVSHRENTRKPSRFCSWECRIKSKDKIIKCLQCGVEFRVSNSKDRKFCSQTCSNRYNQKPNPDKKSVFICQWCGKEFIEWTYRNPSVCSNQCRSEYGASIRAKQLYKGGEITFRGIGWKQQAKLARKRDNYTCQACGRHSWVDKFFIQVHHIKPFREFGEDYESANSLDNLISLCPSCHPKVEAGTVKLKPRS